MRTRSKRKSGSEVSLYGRVRKKSKPFQTDTNLYCNRSTVVEEHNRRRLAGYSRRSQARVAVATAAVAFGLNNAEMDSPGLFAPGPAGATDRTPERAALRAVLGHGSRARIIVCHRDSGIHAPFAVYRSFLREKRDPPAPTRILAPVHTRLFRCGSGPRHRATDKDFIGAVR